MFVIRPYERAVGRKVTYINNPFPVPKLSTALRTERMHYKSRDTKTPFPRVFTMLRRHEAGQAR